MCYLCYAQRSPICCALSLPLAGCQSGDGTIGNRKKFNKVPESAFLIPRRTPTLEAFLPAPLYLFIYFSFLEVNTNLCLYGKNARPILVPHDIKSGSYTGKLSRCRRIVSDSIWFFFKPPLFTLQQPQKSTLRPDNAFALTLAMCGRLDGLAFTWWTWQSSAASRPWINHAECEYLPQEKPCDCVCVYVWETESHILRNSRDWIPRKLIRGSFRTVPGCCSNMLQGSRHLVSLQPPRSSGKKLR